MPSTRHALVALFLFSSGCLTDEGLPLGEVGQEVNSAVEQGFVRSIHSASTIVYPAEGPNSLNSGGGSVTVNWLSVGYYKVTFASMVSSTGGHVQVTAFGQGSERCKLLTFGRTGGNAWAFVRCHNLNGNLVNAQFALWYTGAGHRAARGAYLYADEPSRTSLYYAHPTYHWRSSGTTAWIQRQSTGVYDVGLDSQSVGNVQVTALGTDSASCKVVSQTQDGPDVKVRVACFTMASGDVDRVDSRFLLDLVRAPLSNDNYSVGAFTHANQPSTTSWYEPTPAFHEDGSPVWGRKVNSGTYEVLLFQRQPQYAAPLVTASSAGTEFCKVAAVGESSDFAGASSMVVRCWDPSGLPHDSTFFALYAQEPDRSQ